jgi:exonuclease VII small subunit
MSDTHPPKTQIYPTRSNWLAKAVKDLDHRDPLDAYSDARQLVAACEQRLKAIECQHGITFVPDD